MGRTKHQVPATGWKGITLYWRNDLAAAFSVALVALPLSLGIALASGVEPMSGLIASIIGGLVTTFFRGGHVAINGPAAGLIAVVLGAIVSMDDGSGQAINYMLAAVVVSGGIQILMGVFRLGKLANAFPSSVITGMLAAIGVIILSKQVHVALGTASEASSTLATLVDVFRQLPQLNPFIAIISLVSILIMIFHSRLPFRFFRTLPAPIWVLAFAISLVYFFNFQQPHIARFMGASYALGPELLVQIPANPLAAILFPNFSQIGTPEFWMAVLSITLIGTLETLAIARAVDKLDPYRRVTNTSKDLIGNGLATLICGCIGGLPIIPLIARSSVNIQNNAKTKWSNFYYGLFLLLFVVLFGSLIQKVPLAALAAILVFTGYQLASPRVFRLTYQQGVEQLLVLLTTVLVTLGTDLLWGIIAGLVSTLIIHLLRARLSIKGFFYFTFWSKPKLEKMSDQYYRLSISGVANFLSVLVINRALQQIPSGATVIIDLSATRLVDLTVQERIRDFARRYEEKGGIAKIRGLDKHRASSDHPLSLKVNSAAAYRS
ncbi:MAG TPA: SulP family inorganic anion transporter [Saprospiraceae bacterium]|nr:SulP family inorganic anion transporter [Saprospiraceae bacterium]